ncbi:MAG: hypothetical protein AB2417_15740 [Clostridiaceae bacterium]
MAVGQQLPQPEQGWKRYDFADDIIEYTGVWGDDVNREYWNGTIRYTNTPNSKARFNFTGDKFRLIGLVYNNKNDNIKIILDGEEYYFSERSGNTPIFRVIVFEKVGLENTEHYVEILAPDNIAVGRDMAFDAIDVDINSILKPYRIYMGKYLIKQNDNYYTTHSNYLKLGQPTNLDELDNWFRDYGTERIQHFQDVLTSKKVPMVEGVGNIYESLDVNLNDIKKEDLYITEEDNKTYFEYDYNNYKIIDEIRKVNGGIGNVVFKEY